ncbi:MAG: tetratricopeptide repeat protein [Thermoleophilia bacterium]|nr:tetratricopeptide repeat protein [Thermoleophilia bacterium]
MSSRARAYLLVAVIAAAAAAIAVAVAWSGQPEEAAGGGPREGVPPLVLDVLVEDEGQARRLAEAAALYAGGRLAEALAAFGAELELDPDSVPAAVGAALARWPRGTLAALEQLAAANPGSALVRLHLGLVRFWRGEDALARQEWARAEQAEPDSGAAVRAESLLHPDLPAGRPFVVASATPPAELSALPPLRQLEELGRWAGKEGTAPAWVTYGSALQRAGRPVSARAAFERAVELAPADPEALAALALGGFDKDDPGATASSLELLAERFPGEPAVAFHLGLVYLWVGQVESGRAALERARLAAGTVWATEAARLLDRLGETPGDASP